MRYDGDVAPRAGPVGGTVRVLQTLRGYRVSWLSGDIAAGVMLAAIALPEQLATAKLAGFPPEAGLYAFAAGTIAFALLGANRFASVGADSTTAPIFAASLGTLAVAGGAVYHGLAGFLAVVVGAILIAVGAARAGWVADLLSIPVTTGFLAGIAIHIIIGQLPSLLGVAPTTGPLIDRFIDAVAALPHANPLTCALGLGVLAAAVAASRLSERIPGALIGIVGAGIAVTAFDLRSRGVAVLGPLSGALPIFHIPPLPPVAQLAAIAPLAVVIAAVCALQTSLVIRSFPSQPDAADAVGPDFIAIGVGSMLAGCAGAFPVNASPPRTAVARGAGAQSQACGLAALVVIVVAVGFFARFGSLIPQAALAGVLMFIGSRLFRLHDMIRIARGSRREIQLVIVAALLVVVLPIQTGMLLAIMLSLAHGVSLVMWPPAVQLFAVPGTTVWWPSTGEHDVVDVPGVIVFAPSAPVNFTNAQYIRERLFRLVATAKGPVRLLVIEGSGMSDIDYTGSQMLQAAIARLRGRGIDVALARLIGPHAQEAAQRSGLIAALGSDRVYLSVSEAVAGEAKRAAIGAL